MIISPPGVSAINKETLDLIFFFLSKNVHARPHTINAKYWNTVIEIAPST
jgi:hypothetical protein